jgi:ribonuclease HI
MNDPIDMVTHWAKKYAQWPKLNWGLVLGCNLLQFRTVNGALIIISEKGRLFAIIVSVTWNLIWNLHVSRVITHPNIIITDTEIHNRLLKAINGALQRDHLLCDKIKFGTLALKKQCVLNMWSSLLLDEASLPDDWINEGVLVGIQPIVDKIGIG